jgi:hypothetical protein
METTIKPGKYRHYKGKYYEVTGIARHSETHPEEGGNFGVRPVKMFLEEVEVNGKRVPRFEKCND